MMATFRITRVINRLNGTTNCHSGFQPIKCACLPAGLSIQLNRSWPTLDSLQNDVCIYIYRLWLVYLHIICYNMLQTLYPRYSSIISIHPAIPLVTTTGACRPVRASNSSLKS